MTRRNFSLQKENGCKVQLSFVKCCTLVVTEGYHIYHILLSPLNKLVTCHFIMSTMYIIRTSWAHIKSKRQRSWRFWAPQKGLRTPRKFLYSKEYLHWLNDTGKTFVLLNSVQEFIEIQAWLLLTFFLCLHNQLISVYYMSQEYRCLKNAIHQLERDEWLLL